MRAARRVRCAALICVLSSTLVGAPGCFYFKAAAGQLSLINGQEPLAAAYARERDPERLWMLRETPRVLRFARDVLLLKPPRSYRGYVETEAPGLTYVVSACQATRFEPHTWWFPVAGEVGYKSHFNEADAQAEAAALAAQGLDVWVGPSRAYSTLGLFRDPVVTTMMRAGPTAYVEVLIHELAHARLYVPGQTEFNEQLASFVGRKGTERYFQSSRFSGTGVVAFVRAQHARGDRMEEIIHRAIARLDRLYEGNLPDAEVLRRRAPILRGLERALAALAPDRDPSELRMNNARLMQYKRYGRRAPYLERMWAQSRGSFRQFWQAVEAHARELSAAAPEHANAP